MRGDYKAKDVQEAAAVGGDDAVSAGRQAEQRAKNYSLSFRVYM